MSGNILEILTDVLVGLDELTRVMADALTPQRAPATL
jgi:hypothetical protein